LLLFVSGLKSRAETLKKHETLTKREDKNTFDLLVLTGRDAEKSRKHLLKGKIKIPLTS
jgi:hypothetical protein